MSHASEIDIKRAGFVESHLGWNHPSVPVCTECVAEGEECTWDDPTKNTSHPGALDLPPKCMHCLVFHHRIDQPCSTAQRLEYIGMPDENHSEPYFMMRDGRKLGLADKDKWHLDVPSISSPDLPSVPPGQPVSESRTNPVILESEHANLDELIQHRPFDPILHSEELTTGLLEILKSDKEGWEALFMAGRRVDKSAKEAVGQVQEDATVLHALQREADKLRKLAAAGSVIPAELSEAELVELLDQRRRHDSELPCLTSLETEQLETVRDLQRDVVRVRNERDQALKERNDLASTSKEPGEVDSLLFGVIRYLDDTAEESRKKASTLEETAECLKDEFHARQQRKRKREAGW